VVKTNVMFYLLFAHSALYFVSWEFVYYVGVLSFRYRW